MCSLNQQLVLPKRERVKGSVICGCGFRAHSLIGFTSILGVGSEMSESVHENQQ